MGEAGVAEPGRERRRRGEGVAAKLGQGGVAGFAKGEASVNLTPEGKNTKLAYSAKAAVGGKLAQVGARLIDGVAKQLAGKFFETFNRRASRG